MRAFNALDLNFLTPISTAIRTTPAHADNRTAATFFRRSFDALAYVEQSVEVSRNKDSRIVWY